MIKIKKQEVQEERDPPPYIHKIEKRKYSQKGSMIVGQTERQKSEIKTQNTNTKDTAVQGRREKKHRKTIIMLHVCKNTCCDCVDHSTFPNYVLNSEVKMEW
jgi:hypothetical protein